MSPEQTPAPVLVTEQDLLVSAYMLFENNLSQLQSFGMPAQMTDEIEQLVRTGHGMFLNHGPNEPDRWRGFIEYGGAIAEQEVGNINPQPVRVVRALERYIEMNRPRPNVRVR